MRLEHTSLFTTYLKRMDDVHFLVARVEEVKLDADRELTPSSSSQMKRRLSEKENEIKSNAASCA